MNELDHTLPAFLVDGLPDPQALKVTVKERIQQAYAALHADRVERGGVARPEDTYDLHRRLQATRERVEDYARGFKDVGTLIGQLQQEELVEAVGEQDGIPISGLTIPSAGGDITVKPAFKRENDIDANAVREAVVNGIADAWAGTFLPGHATMEDCKIDLRECLTQALAVLVGTGKWEPQVSKLKATAAEWARAGNDSLAGKLMAAHQVRNKYLDKVEVTRKAPK